MLGIDYASDSDEDVQPESKTVVSAKSSTAASASSATSPGKSAGTKPGALTGSSLKLPPLSNTPSAAASKKKTTATTTTTTTTAASGGGLSLQPQKTKKAPGTKKIKLELPRLEKKLGSDDDEGGLSDDEPSAKKPRLNGSRATAAGTSSLLSMLPAPKRAVPEPAPAPQRVLGGGKPGVVYFAATSTEFEEKTDSVSVDARGAEEKIDEDDQRAERTHVEMKSSAMSLLPPSLQSKAKAKAMGKMKTDTKEPGVQKEEVDFFSLGTPSAPSRVSTSSPSPLTSTSTSTTATTTAPQPALASTLSSAPTVTDFRPPSPKIDDPYPGYYQLPSGTWAMHDPALYQSYTTRWRQEYDAHIKQLEASARFGVGSGSGSGFGYMPGAHGEPTDIRASDLADSARAAREEAKSLTRHAAHETDRPVPKVALNASKTGGLARTRHQLHALLTDAYLNREALEERIAQGKRNRKEAGNKYGF